MNEYIPYASFYDIQKKFWSGDKKDNKNKKSKKNKKDKKDKINKINSFVTNRLECMFSNINIRILSAKLKNPLQFKGVTLFLDGHDSQIDYEDISVNKYYLYSYKLEKSGVRTQFCSDINGFILFVSPSMYCKDNCDGEMFLNMKIEKKISPLDCIAFDGGYYHYKTDFIENSAKIGVDFSNNNFMHPIRKVKNVDLAENETNFNKTFGSFRSSIETVFANLGCKFKMFSNNTKVTRVTNVSDYNLKFKTMCLLYNIQLFVNLYNIEVNEIHKQWYNDNFDIKYTDEFDNTENVDIEERTIMEIKENHADIIDLQYKFLGIDINNYMDEDSTHIEEDFVIEI